MNDPIAPPGEYKFDSAAPPCNVEYLVEPLLSICRRYQARKIFDVGCGNGAIVQFLERNGLTVAGCDPSESGIEHARATVPNGNFFVHGVYDDPHLLKAGQFDLVISTEVVEHLFNPRFLPRFGAALLRPGGYLVVSTPYHGFAKNLALSIFDKWDFHHTPLWDGGHIKFWSRRTLTELLETEGFKVCEFVGAGRWPFFWKSMIIVARLRGGTSEVNGGATPLERRT